MVTTKIDNSSKCRKLEVMILKVVKTKSGEKCNSSVYDKSLQSKMNIFYKIVENERKNSPKLKALQ